MPRVVWAELDNQTAAAGVKKVDIGERIAFIVMFFKHNGEVRARMKKLLGHKLLLRTLEVAF